MDDFIIKLIRTLVRPIITIFLVISWVSSLPESAQIIPFTALTWGCTVWWFGDRTYFKRKVANNGGYDLVKLL